MSLAACDDFVFTPGLSSLSSSWPPPSALQCTRRRQPPPPPPPFPVWSGLACPHCSARAGWEKELGGAFRLFFSDPFGRVLAAHAHSHSLRFAVAQIDHSYVAPFPAWFFTYFLPWNTKEEELIWMDCCQRQMPMRRTYHRRDRGQQSMSTFSMTVVWRWKEKGEKINK